MAPLDCGKDVAEHHASQRALSKACALIKAFNAHTSYTADTHQITRTTRLLVREILPTMYVKQLFTWKLSPTVAQSELWQFSTHRGEVWTRARDAVQARLLTSENFRLHSAKENPPSQWKVPGICASSLPASK
jgi:hypothetical protein